MKKEVKDVRITFRVEESMKEKIEERAEDCGRTVSDYIYRLIQADLKKSEGAIKVKKRFEVKEVYEGKSKDYNDIKITIKDKEYWAKDIPLLDESGKDISYDEALKLYGESGLSDDIWSDEAYINNIEVYIKDNNIELEEI
jgi:hypothetical protein